MPAVGRLSPTLPPACSAPQCLPCGATVSEGPRCPGRVPPRISRLPAAWTARDSQRGTIRILQVITDTDRRGAQIFAVDLAEHLDGEGRHVRTVALTGGAGSATLDVAALGTRRLAPVTLRNLRRWVRGADVVVAHGSSTLPAGLLAGLGTATPVVYRNIGDPAFWMARPDRRLRVRALLARTAAVVSLWRGGARFLVEVLGVPAGKVRVIPNAVRPERFRPADAGTRAAARQRFGLPADAVVLLSIAALHPEKHADTAIEALTGLPEAHLLVVGDGPCRPGLETLAALRAPGRVRFAGQIGDPEAAYAAADVLVLPSESEGLPAVLIEAGLAGVPAVASSSGGNAEIIEDGVTGRIVPPADPARLAAAVTDVLDAPGEVAERARRHCLGAFTIGPVAARWRDLLIEVL